MMQPLTIAEQELYNSLQVLNHDSIWGIAIQNVCKAQDTDRFRSLVQQLHSQNKDCPEVMKVILGNSYPLLLNISHA